MRRQAVAVLLTMAVAAGFAGFGGGLIGSYLDRHGVSSGRSLLVFTVWLVWCGFSALLAVRVGLWLGGRWEARAHRRTVGRALATAAQEWERLTQTCWMCASWPQIRCTVHKAAPVVPPDPGATEIAAPPAPA